MFGLVEDALQHDIEQFVHGIEKLWVIFDPQVIIAPGRTPVILEFLQYFFYFNRTRHEVLGNVVELFIRAAQQVAVHVLIDGIYVFFYQGHVIAEEVAAGLSVTHRAISQEVTEYV